MPRVFARSLAVALLTLAVVCTQSCGGEATVAVPPAQVVTTVTSVTVSPTGTTSLLVGATRQLSATVQGSTGVSQVVTWRSADATKVAVSISGLITAVAPSTGTAVCADANADPSKSGCATITVAPAQYSLTVAVLDGVIGTPAVGATMRNAGASVSYSFGTDSTHENLRVFVDGEAAPATATIQMTSNRTLAALADRKVMVPSAVQPQVDAISNAMKAIVGPRPLDSYRATTSAIAAMAPRVTADSLARYIRVARLNAYAGLDVNAIARGIKEINDSSAVLAATTPAAAPQTAVRLAGTGGVLFLYINGINTAADDANTTATHFLPRVIAAAGYADPLLYSIETQYNRTGNTSDVRAIAAQVCIQQRADAVAEGGRYTFGNAVCDAIVTALFGKVDLTEAYLQVLVASLARVPATGTGLALATKIATRLQTRRVVVVAHSQGNLFVNEAYRSLERITGVNAACVGTVSLAPPIPIVPLRGGRAVDASIVAGATVKDVLLKADDILPGSLPGIQTVPKFLNAMSDVLNQAYDVLNDNLLRLLSVGVLLLHQFELNMFGSVALHSIDNDYLGFNRSITAAAIQRQVQGVLENCVSNLDIARPADGSVGTAVAPIQVRVLAPGDELATQITTPVSVTLAANASGATLSSVTPVVPTGGIARFTNIVINGAGTGLRLAFSAGGVTTLSAPFTVWNGQLDAVAGVNQTATVGQMLTNPMVVVMRDAASLAPLSGRTITFTTVAGNGTVSSGTATTGVDGRAGVNWTLGTVAGTQSLTASVTGALGSPVTFTATARAGSASRLLMGSGNSQSAAPGTTLPQSLQVQAVDAYGNAVSGISVLWAVTSGGGSFQPNGVTQQSVATNAAGVSAVQWRIGTGSGTNNNAATASGTGLSGSPLTFLSSGQVGAATRLAFTRQPVAAITGGVLTPSVQVAVQNAAGATVATATNSVTLALAPSTGVTFGGTLTRPAVNGIATFDNLTVSAPGTYTLIAASTSLTNATSTSFTVSTSTGPFEPNNTPGTATRIQPGETQTHTLPVGDVDWLMLALPKTSAVRLTLTGASNVSHVHSFALYDSTGTRLLANSSGIAANGVVLQYSAAPIGAKVRICADLSDSWCESHTGGDLDLGVYQVSFAITSSISEKPANVVPLDDHPERVRPDTTGVSSARAKAVRGAR